MPDKLQNSTFWSRALKSITSAVQQGSILGRSMFIVFFNDLHDSIKNCKIIQYPVDTVILFADKNMDKIEDYLNVNNYADNW